MPEMLLFRVVYRATDATRRTCLRRLANPRKLSTSAGSRTRENLGCVKRYVQRLIQKSLEQERRVAFLLTRMPASSQQQTSVLCN